MKMIKEIFQFLSDQVNWAVAGFAAKITPLLTVVVLFLQDFFHPTVPSLFYVMTLGLFDIITGVWASHKEGKKISSEFFWRRKAAVVVLFLMGVISMLIIDRMLKDLHESAPAFALTSWLGFYAIYEVISVLENMTRIGYLRGIKAFMNFFKKKIGEDIKEAVEEAKKEDK